MNDFDQTFVLGFYNSLLKVSLFSDLLIDKMCS